MKFLTFRKASHFPSIEKNSSNHPPKHANSRREKLKDTRPEIFARPQNCRCASKTRRKQKHHWREAFRGATAILRAQVAFLLQNTAHRASRNPRAYQVPGAERVRVLDMGGAITPRAHPRPGPTSRPHPRRATNKAT
jgi:hypothetical protein